MSSDDLMRKARLAAMLEESGEAPPPPKPTAKKPEDALVSDNTKTALKTAGTLAGMAGKWGLGKAKQAAVATVEKTKQVQEAAAHKLEAAKQAREDEAVNRATPAHQESVDTPASAGGEVSDGMGVEAPELLNADANAAPFEGVSSEVIETVLADMVEAGMHAGPGFLTPEPPGDDAREVVRTVLEETGYDLTDSNDEPTFTPPLEDPLGEPAPLPDDPYSEELSQPSTGSDDAPSRRKPWPWVMGGVVCLGLGAYFLFGPSDTDLEPSTPPTPSLVTPPAAVTLEPAMDVPANIEEQPVPAPVEADAVPVVESTPEPEQAPSPIAAEPQPAVVEQPPAEVEAAPVARVVQAAPRTEPKPAPRPAPRPVQRAPAAAPAKPESAWQDKAKQDMDRWAQDMGIE